MSTWEELRQECLNCRKCGLCQTRTNVVFGVGKEDAEVMFIGEGPGQQEDLKGEPFVGRSGQLGQGLHTDRRRVGPGARKQVVALMFRVQRALDRLKLIADILKHGHRILAGQGVGGG